MGHMNIHGARRSVVVVSPDFIQEDVPGEKRLVAYLEILTDGVITGFLLGVFFFIGLEILLFKFKTSFCVSVQS